jgi:hypothetical protein
MNVTDLSPEDQAEVRRLRSVIIGNLVFSTMWSVFGNKTFAGAIRNFAGQLGEENLSRLNSVSATLEGLLDHSAQTSAALNDVFSTGATKNLAHYHAAARDACGDLKTLTASE